MSHALKVYTLHMLVLMAARTTKKIISRNVSLISVLFLRFNTSNNHFNKPLQHF